MSTVVGLKFNGKLYLGSDTQYTDEHGVASYGARKIHRVGEMLIGNIGAAMPGVQSKYLQLPDIENPREYMALDFPIVVQNFMDKYGTGEDFEWLIGFRGDLYNFDSSNYECVPCRNYHAIGSGSQFALASIHIGNGKVYPEDTVKRAINIAMHFDAYTGGEVVIECS